MYNKSKIAIFRKAGTPVSIEECSIPELKQGELLVKMNMLLSVGAISALIWASVSKKPYHTWT